MLVLMFPGQGSQRPGMGAAWHAHPSWRVAEQIASEVGMDVTRLLVGADAEELRATANAQMATFALSMVILDALRAAIGPEKAVLLTAVAGHSLGEYSALAASGALTVAQAGRLVRERGLAMQSAAEMQGGTMAAVLGLGVSQVAAACAGVTGAWVANDNAPGQVVISGTVEGVAAAGRTALAQGAKRVVPLQVGGAFHSPLMEPARERLAAALETTAFAVPDAPVVANVDAAAHAEGFEGLLAAQLCSQVRWRDSLAKLEEMGGKLFVELGPGTELSGMVRRTLSEAARANVAVPADLEGAHQAVAALGA